MTVEMTRFEAEILIAVLTFAEGVAPMTEPAMVEAIKELRSWRSALIGSYVRSVGEPQVAPARVQSDEPAQGFGSAADRPEAET